jgi:hypothetical protein
MIYISEENTFKIWQFNKIREVLKKKYNAHGYPMRKGCYVGYGSGVGLWIPDFWSIAESYTRAKWIEHPETQFKTVWIYRNQRSPVEVFSDMLANGVSPSNLTEMVAGTLNDFADQWLRNPVAEAQMFVNTLRPYEVYPHIAFYGTCNDYLIFRNINYVVQDMESMGWTHDGTLVDAIKEYNEHYRSFGQVPYLLSKTNEQYPDDYDFSNYKPVGSGILLQFLYDKISQNRVVSLITGTITASVSALLNTMLGPILASMGAAGVSIPDESLFEQYQDLVDGGGSMQDVVQFWGDLVGSF